MKIKTQFLRYVVVGALSNALLYFTYLLLTYIGIGPKLAMSLLYVVGVLQTFVFNRKWSFGFVGAVKPAFVRYTIVYATGYIINFLVLMLLVDLNGFPHQFVMGSMVLFMAVFFFICQKFWVFGVKASVLPRSVT